MGPPVHSQAGFPCWFWKLRFHILPPNNPTQGERKSFCPGLLTRVPELSLSGLAWIMCSPVSQSHSQVCRDPTACTMCLPSSQG